MSYRFHLFIRHGQVPDTMDAWIAGKYEGQTVGQDATAGRRQKVDLVWDEKNGRRNRKRVEYSATSIMEMQPRH